MRLYKKGLGSLARLAIGSHIELVEGEVRMAAGGCRAALDRLEAVDSLQLPQAVEIVELMMALAHACQAHVLVTKGT